MARADFVHLRVHSAYSLSEGAIKLKELIKLCQRYAMPAVAVTDTGNLFGALEFAMAAREAGVQPIIGCLLGITNQEERGRMQRRPAPDRLLILVQNEVGYANLMKLVSRSYLEGEPGEPAQLALASLEGATDGLLALTGGPEGAVGRLLAEGQDEAAEAMLAHLSKLFPKRLYVELMRHGREVERQIEERSIALAYAHDLPLVATNDAYFADADLYEAHDALLCIAEQSYVSQTDRRRLTGEYWFKPAEAMRALFADLPEALDNTMVIARRSAFMPEPRKPILPAFPTENGLSEAAELKRRAEAGLERRLQTQVFRPDMDEAMRDRLATPYRRRLDYELGVIGPMGFPGYFLVVADFIQWAKSAGIPVGPGRGSGAGSVVAWALTITDLDPLRWGLLFERFLNPERVSMPDFDIDFCQDQRDRVIDYVQQKYGRDRVAQIITFGKLQARAVLRDVGRVLQMPYGQVDRLCKMVPNNPANPVSLQQAIDGEPMLREMRNSDPAVGHLIDIALKLEGLYRHASTHAAGVVIGDRPLEELVPLYRDPRSNMPVTQFSMKYVELAGLVKFDFLGLKTLTVLARAVELLAARGIALDLSTLPLDDRASYEMMGRGDTTGVFQLESSGMRDVLRKLKPDRFEDIIAVVALYRPGPMDNIPRYIACKHGFEQPDYLHPSLEGILKETFGIMIYQEQVIQIAQALSGYSLGGADLLRRAMGKKIKAEMEAQRKTFIDGAVLRGVNEAKASQIFDQVDKFAGYGFNKSHAAAYALVAYQTAWLKANHPVEFMAASMTLDIQSTDKLNTFRQELERLKVSLLPPDINRSRATFTVETRPDGKGAIRYALAAIRNVGAAAMAALVAERDAHGPFRSIADFASRTDAKILNKRQLESLAAAGAFDSLLANRRQVFEGTEAILGLAGALAQERSSGQTSLFGAAEVGAGVLALPAVPDWPGMDRLRHEFEAIGFYLSAHPLDAHSLALERLEVVRHADLQRWLAGRPTRRANVAGVVVARQERTSAKGNRFAFVQLSDAAGLYEVVIFSDLLATARELLEPGRAVLLAVEVRSEDDTMRLSAQQIRPLDEAVAATAPSLKVFLDAVEPVAALRALIEREKRGRGRISLVLDLRNGREVDVTLPGAWAISPACRAAIKAIPGVIDVHDV